jgi:outer membrane receptor protein involved in Fe transport
VYTPAEWLIIDADYAFAHSRLADEVDARIPNAVSNVVSMGLSVVDLGPWSGGLRWRHFGSAPLIEDNSVRSDPTSVLNGQISYALTEAVSVTLAGYNLFDSNDNDITYFYESQLAGEADPVEDIHFHPVEPRTFRIFVSFSL